MNTNKTSIRTKLFLVIVGTIITASFGAYNNFPFLYPDSTAYLFSSQDISIPEDRPIFYGLFLRITHMRENLYFTMLAQSLLLAYTLYLPFRILKKNNNYGILYLITLIILSLCTGYSFFACYLMPDFFGMILFICSWLLFYENLDKRDTIVCSTLLLISLLVHNANFYIYILLVAFSGIFMITRNGKARSISVTKWVFVNLAIIMFALILQSVFKHKSSGHLFLTSRLNETGILSDFLNRNCQTGNYALCAYKDSLVGDYLWDNKSPMSKIGGREESAIPEYNRMLKDMLFNGHTFKKIAIMSFYSTIEQFFSFEIEPHHPLKPDSIREIFPTHKFDMEGSFQNRPNRLNFSFINDRQWILVISSLGMIVILLLFGENLHRVQHRRFVFLLVFLVINAAIFGTFSTVLTRYQGRIIALVPYMVLLNLPDISSVIRQIFRSIWYDEKESMLKKDS